MSRDWADSDFVRIYHSIKTDEKLRAVYDNKALLGWYVTLLLEAHSAYPQPAYIPRSMPDTALNPLVDIGVIAVDGDFYTVCGLSKEKAEVIGRQGGMIRAATAERDEGGRFIAGIPTPLPDNADGRDDIEAYVQIKRRAPTPKQRQLLDDILARHDVTGPKWAADIMLSNPENPIGALLDADRAWRDERKAYAVAEERRSQRRKPGLRDPLLQEIARTFAEKQNDTLDVSLQTGVESVA